MARRSTPRSPPASTPRAGSSSRRTRSAPRSTTCVRVRACRRACYRTNGTARGYRLDGSAEVLDLPDALEPLVEYFRVHRGRALRLGRVPRRDATPREVPHPHDDRAVGPDRNRRVPAGRRRLILANLATLAAVPRWEAIEQSEPVRGTRAAPVRCGPPQDDRNAACRRFTAHLRHRVRVRRRRPELRFDARRREKAPTSPRLTLCAPRPDLPTRSTAKRASGRARRRSPAARPRRWSDRGGSRPRGARR